VFLFMDEFHLRAVSRILSCCAFATASSLACSRATGRVKVESSAVAESDDVTVSFSRVAIVRERCRLLVNCDRSTCRSNLTEHENNDDSRILGVLHCS